MKKYQSFLSKNFQFLEVKFSIHLNRRVFVMNKRFVCRVKKISRNFEIFFIFFFPENRLAS